MKSLPKAKKHKTEEAFCSRDILLWALRNVAKRKKEREMKFEYFLCQFKYLITIKRINCGFKLN